MPRRARRAPRQYRRKPKRKSTPRSRRGFRGLRRWLLLSLVAALLGGALYVVYLDQVVRMRFEGRRWSLPARVYARPLELYAGRAMRPESWRFPGTSRTVR